MRYVNLVEAKLKGFKDNKVGKALTGTKSKEKLTIHWEFFDLDRDEFFYGCELNMVVKNSTRIEVGRAYFKFDQDGDELVPFDTYDTAVEVDEKYRRLGIANKMYELAEKLTSKNLVGGGEQSKDASALWSQKNRPWGKGSYK